jgi:hypothetical protein
VETYKLSSDLVTRAKRILGTRTETEAIIRSLEEIVYEDEIHCALWRAGGRVQDAAPLR